MDTGCDSNHGHYDESGSLDLTSIFNCLSFERCVSLNAGGLANLKSGKLPLRHLAYHTEKELRDAEAEEVEMKTELCTCYPPSLVGVRAL